MSNPLDNPYKTWIEKLGDSIYSDDYETLYNEALPLVSGVTFTAEDIRDFLNTCKGSGTLSKIGLLLSAAINQVMQNDQTIELLVQPWTSFLGVFLERGTIILKPADAESGYHACYQFGYRMRGGNLIVEENTYADVGFEMTGGNITSIGNYEISSSYQYGKDRGFGKRMSGGKITLKGDLIYYSPKGQESPFAEMSGGEVEILGNVKNSCTNPIGFNMTNGTIKIYKNCDFVGGFMRGGSIEICGDSKTVGWHMKGGKVHVKGDAEIVGSEMEGGEILIDGNCESDVGASIKDNSRIHVKGNVGKQGIVGGHVGWGMMAGLIEVDGDVYGKVGYEMRGGYLYVKGNSLSEGVSGVGFVMSNGEIKIEGDVKGGVGYQMKNGIIRVEGYMLQKNYGLWDGFVRWGGQVFRRGELVRDSIGARVIKWTQKK